MIDLTEQDMKTIGQDRKIYKKKYNNMGSLSAQSRLQTTGEWIWSRMSDCSDTPKSHIIARMVLEDIWGEARRGLLRSSSLSQESSVVQLALRST
jgi:hypothetical protein